MFEILQISSNVWTEWAAPFVWLTSPTASCLFHFPIDNTTLGRHTLGYCWFFLSQTYSFSAFLCVKGMYWLCEIPVASGEWYMKWKVFFLCRAQWEYRKCCAFTAGPSICALESQIACVHAALPQNPWSSHLVARGTIPQKGRELHLLTSKSPFWHCDSAFATGRSFPL